MPKKEEIIIKSGNFEILEKTASKFGTGAHIIISKKYSGEKTKIVIGKCRVLNGQINLDFFKSEILERKASKFGTGAHIIIPKEYAGKKIKIIIGGGKKWNLN